MCDRECSTPIATVLPQSEKEGHGSAPGNVASGGGCIHVLARRRLEAKKPKSPLQKCILHQEHAGARMRQVHPQIDSPVLSEQGWKEKGANKISWSSS